MATPQYKLALGHKFFDNMRMHDLTDPQYDPNTVIEFGGEPGENLIPLNAEAKEAKKRSGKVQPAKPLDADERRELETLRAKVTELEKAA